MSNIAETRKIPIDNNLKEIKDNLTITKKKFKRKLKIKWSEEEHSRFIKSCMIHGAQWHLVL